MQKRIQVLLLITGFIAVAGVKAEHGDERIIAGWLETVVLSPSQIKLRAKLDSGAKTSSIHAENVERFERDGEKWIRFNPPKGRDKKAVVETIEAPFLREVLIKRHNMLSATRSVVEISFCINAHYYTAQFTLADRGNFNYPVLLGRRFLQNKILIDSAETFIHDNKFKRNNCNDPRLQENTDEIKNNP